MKVLHGEAAYRHQFKKQELSKLHDDLNSFLYQKLTPIEKLGEGVGGAIIRGRVYILGSVVGA